MAAVLQNEYGIVPYQLSMREFPSVDQATFAMTEGGAQRVYNSSNGRLDLQGVRSIWWRRPENCYTPQVFGGFDRGEFIQAECDHFLQGVLWSHDCLWVNNPMQEVFASRKVVQLSKARDAGLRVPKTLITNNPDEARAFIEALPGRAIFKRTGSSPGPAAKTKFVTLDTLQNLKAISSSPTTFQEYVEGSADLRVVWIDGDLWAVSIDSQASTTPEDCRFDYSVTYAPHVLPHSVQRSLTLYLSRLGLVYGAVDLRIGDDGEYYFFEVNPSGQFAFLEVKTGLPLMSALAAVLARGASKANKTARQAASA